jgi:hypothetical protein
MMVNAPPQTGHQPLDTSTEDVEPTNATRWIPATTLSGLLVRVRSDRHVRIRRLNKFRNFIVTPLGMGYSRNGLGTAPEAQLFDF